MKKKILINSILLIGLSLLLTLACKKDETPEDTTTGKIPVLTTTNITDITHSTAFCGGNITNQGDSSIKTRGVCWSTQTNPTIIDNKTIDNKGTGTFTSSILKLKANTTYFVRAYATNNIGTAYGDNVSFTTLQDSSNTVTDLDGNVYHTITIGTQVWMVENLKTTKYRNGTSIPNISVNTTWIVLNTGAYCNYENDANNLTTYGRLYNWYAVIDTQNIAPIGWHVPSDSEWTVLTSYLGGDSIAGRKLKEAGTTHWSSPNTGTTNETGFTALPSGARFSDGKFYDLKNIGYWWSVTEQDTYTSWRRYMYYAGSSVNKQAYSKKNGFSVRCVKD